MNQGIARQVNTQQQQNLQQQQPPQQKPFLFYGDETHSKNLIALIRTSKILTSGIIPVSVEDADNLPENLKSVPTILVNGTMFTGNDAFGWVQMQIERLKGGSTNGSAPRSNGDPNAHMSRNNMQPIQSAASVAADAMKNSMNQNVANKCDPGDPAYMECISGLAGASIAAIDQSGAEGFKGSTQDTRVESDSGYMSIYDFEHNTGGSLNGQITQDPTRMASQGANRMKNEGATNALTNLEAARNAEVPQRPPMVGGGASPFSQQGSNQLGQMGANQMGGMPQMQQHQQPQFQQFQNQQQQQPPQQHQFR